MMKIIGFSLNASQTLSFSRGTATDDEPEIWQKSLADEIDLWIDFGQLDERRIRRACGRARQVVVYTYNKRKASIWWQKIHPALARWRNLRVFHIDAVGAEALHARKMQLDCSIDDGQIYLANATDSVAATVTEWLPD